MNQAPRIRSEMHVLTDQSRPTDRPLGNQISVTCTGEPVPTLMKTKESGYYISIYAANSHRSIGCLRVRRTRSVVCIRSMFWDREMRSPAAEVRAGNISNIAVRRLQRRPRHELRSLSSLRR
ncbi:hypothetical protein M758_4G043300 [Ceratodon purpureus]|uniref:Uncharacterized protein n=1 Tax=Ceratodon purpureus TaxID=3225 RepID=A0A8T0I5K3_CERPU|nr:hypothetical protein KC19_4G046200 [Ceratodon purpureus]KAG0618146.1 hypothetical protein M758_4G043300 [Ceratodon purpureus]